MRPSSSDPRRAVARILIAALAVLAPLQAALATTPEITVLGADEDGEGLLFRPRQVEEGPDGNLYVLDMGDASIKVFSPSGEYLRLMGGEGEGPGEFQRVDGASFGFTTDGRLFFTEYFGGHRWITIMDLQGDLVDVLPLELDVGFGVNAAHALDDGGFLVHLTYSAIPRAEGDYYLYDMPESLVRVDGRGEFVDDLVRTEYTKLISTSPNGGDTSLPFTPVFAWVADAEGNVTWSDGMSPRLRLLDRTGAATGHIETRLPAPEKVTDAELDAWKRERRDMLASQNPDWWQRFGRVVEEYDEPLYDKPILRRLSLTPRGNLLAEGTWEPDAEGVRYWLIDARGEILRTVRVDGWRLHFSRSFLLFFSEDGEGGVSTNVMTPPPDEAAALSWLEGL